MPSTSLGPRDLFNTYLSSGSPPLSLSFPSSFHLTKGPITMPADTLTRFPSELLISIIRFLDPLSLLQCRQVHSHCKSCVDSLPQYKAYRTKFQELVKQCPSTKGAKPRRWTIESAAGLFEIVLKGVEVDYYLFVVLFLKYPKAMSHVLVMRDRLETTVVS